MKFFMPMSVHVIYFNSFIPTIWLTSDKILLLHCRQIKHYIHGNDPHYIHGKEMNRTACVGETCSLQDIIAFLLHVINVIITLNQLTNK